MANELMIVEVQDIERMADAVAKSGLFGLKTKDQAMALMLVAQAEGRHPASAAKDYHIINNNPSKKAEAMLRDFLLAGGKVEWHHLDDKKAEATFSHASGGSAKIDWTLERAAQAGLTGNSNWKKYPRAMLRSRVVSEGVRTIYPAATSGMYEPGEVSDFEPPKKAVKELPPLDAVDVEAKPATHAVEQSLAEQAKFFAEKLKGAKTVKALTALQNDYMELIGQLSGGDEHEKKLYARLEQIIKERTVELTPKKKAVKEQDAISEVLDGDQIPSFLQPKTETQGEV